MDAIDYTELLPKEPPKDIVEVAISKGAFQQEYLIYRAGWEYVPLEDRRVPAVEVVCTKCGSRFIADKVMAGGCHSAYMPAPFGFFHPRITEAVISGSTAPCPVCGVGCKVVHVGNINRNIYDYAYVSQAVRIPVEGTHDRFCLIDWQVQRQISKGGKSSFFTNLWTAWVVEQSKIIRIMGYRRCLSTLSLIVPEQRKTFLDDYGELEYMYPWKSEVLEGTTAENSKLDVFVSQGGKTLIGYMALWRKRPQLENLVMQGCGKLVEELIYNEQHRGTYDRHKGIPKLSQIDWKKKKPNEMLHLSKEEFRTHGKELTVDDLKAIRLMRDSGVEVDIDRDRKLWRRFNEYSIKSVLAIVSAKEFWRALRYLDQQKQGYMVLRDYWKMAQDMETDMTNLRNRWPKNLKRAHDEMLARYKAKEDAALAENFVKRQEMLQKFSWHCDGILIRPCATQAEMILEGSKLNHCVASYAKAHARGDTAIFLIRKEDNPDKPWYTLELDEKTMKVRQNHGAGNKLATPEVAEFQKKWLTHIAKDIARRKSA